MSKCSADCSTLDCRRLHTTAASTDTDTRGGSRSTVDTAVGEESCVQVLRRLQHSRLPSTHTTAASTDTDTRGGSRSTVDTAVGEESCVQVLRRLQHSRLPSTHTSRRLHRHRHTWRQPIHCRHCRR